MPEVDPDISLFSSVFLNKITTANFWGVYDVGKQDRENLPQFNNFSVAICKPKAGILPLYF
jgi:hypothetical protein